MYHQRGHCFFYHDTKPSSSLAPSKGRQSRPRSMSPSRGKQDGGVHHHRAIHDDADERTMRPVAGQRVLREMKENDEPRDKKKEKKGKKHHHHDEDKKSADERKKKKKKDKEDKNVKKKRRKAGSTGASLPVSSDEARHHHGIPGRTGAIDSNDVEDGVVVGTSRIQPQQAMPSLETAGTAATTTTTTTTTATTTMVYEISSDRAKQSCRRCPAGQPLPGCIKLHPGDIGYLDRKHIRCWRGEERCMFGRLHKCPFWHAYDGGECVMTQADKEEEGKGHESLEQQQREMAEAGEGSNSLGLARDSGHEGSGWKGRLWSSLPQDEQEVGKCFFGSAAKAIGKAPCCSTSCVDGLSSTSMSVPPPTMPSRDRILPPQCRWGTECGYRATGSCWCLHGGK